MISKRLVTLLPFSLLWNLLTIIPNLEDSLDVSYNASDFIATKLNFITFNENFEP